MESLYLDFTNYLIPLTTNINTIFIYYLKRIKSAKFFTDKKVNIILYIIDQRFFFAIAKNNLKIKC